MNDPEYPPNSDSVGKLSNLESGSTPLEALAERRRGGVICETDFTEDDGVIRGVLVGVTWGVLVGVDRAGAVDPAPEGVVAEALCAERFSMFLRTIDFRF